MAQASSTNPDSTSSAIASLFLIGITAPDIAHSVVESKRIATKLTRKFRKEAMRAARSNTDWESIAQYLDVGIMGTTVKLYVNGPATVQKQAEILEYGTAEVAPAPMLRVLEAKFTEDVRMSLGGYR